MGGCRQTVDKNMEKKEVKGGVTGRAKAVFKRILEQASAARGREDARDLEYIWICDEVKKERHLQKKLCFLTALIEQLNRWYKKYYERTNDIETGVFVLQMLHFLYHIQFEKKYMEHDVHIGSIQIEMSYLVFMALVKDSCNPNIRSILYYLVQRGAIKVVIAWDEYVYITDSRYQVLNSKIDYIFSSDSPQMINAKEKYIKEKDAYTFMQSLMK